MSQVQTQPQPSELHPIATEASTLYLQGKGSFTPEAIAKLEALYAHVLRSRRP